MSKQIATRLTCFAYISAVEADIRDYIKAQAGARIGDALVADALQKARSIQGRSTASHQRGVAAF